MKFLSRAEMLEEMEKKHGWTEERLLQSYQDVIKALLREGDELGYTLTFDEYVVDFYNSNYYKEV